MNRDLIKLEISRHYWAITDDALNGIVNFVYSNDELEASVFHNETSKPTSYFGESVDGSYYSYKNGDVGVMMIDGPIIPRATFMSNISGAASIDVMSEEFKAMEADDSVREIVLLMDTPGGAVTGISDFSSLVKASKKQTTAYTWMAASAGYEIASATDKIVAPPTGINGSIGTQMTRTDNSEAMAKKGVKVVRVVSEQSPNKNAGLDTENGMAAASMLVSDLADVFIGTVADNRGKTKEEVVSTFGGGALFAAARAKEVGMIDDIQDFESFMNSKVSKSNQSNTLFGFSTTEAKGENMSDSTNETVQLDQEAIAKAERERIQGVESLMSMTEGKHPSIVQAVRGKVDVLKYDKSATKESAEVEVLRAINASQDALVKQMSEEREKVNEAAEHVSGANDEDTISAEQQKINAETDDLVAGAKELR